MNRRSPAFHCSADSPTSASLPCSTLRTCTALGITRTYRKLSASAYRRVSPPCCVALLPRVKSQPNDTSARPKSIVAMRRPERAPFVCAPPSAAMRKSWLASVQQYAAPYSGAWSARLVPAISPNSSHGNAARSHTFRPGLSAPNNGDAVLGGLYLWSKFASRMCSRAGSIYSLLRSRMCRSDRPSAAGVISSSAPENSPSPCQSTISFHFASLIPYTSASSTSLTSC